MAETFIVNLFEVTSAFKKVFKQLFDFSYLILATT